MSGMFSRAYVRPYRKPAFCVVSLALALTLGCGSGLQFATLPQLGITPGTALVKTNQTISFNAHNLPPAWLSDGQGGFLPAQRIPGHFIQLNDVSVTGTADISWNQVIDSPGQASVEDIIDIYDSQGSAANPIDIHDNYLQGAFSAGSTGYTGGGIMTEG